MNSTHGRASAAAAMTALMVTAPAAHAVVAEGAHGPRHKPASACIRVAKAYGDLPGALDARRDVFGGGTQGDDEFYIGAQEEGAPTIVWCGFAGDDLLSDSWGWVYGGPGDDSIGENWLVFRGGPGNDSVSPNEAYFDGGPGNDRVISNSGTFDGGPGDDDVVGAPNSGTVNGGRGRDTVEFNSGTFRGGRGNDVVEINTGVFYGGPGFDRVLTNRGTCVNVEAGC